MNSQEFYKFLDEQIEDGKPSSLENVVELIKKADMAEIRIPCLYSLISWREKGLEELKTLAASGSHKFLSNALTILSIVIAEEKMLPHQGHFLGDKSLQKVNAIIVSAQLEKQARSILRELIISVPLDELMRSIGSSFSMMAITENLAAKELIKALSAKWLHFGPPTLEEYARLLNEHKNDEPVFQDFFTRYPQLLDPMAVKVWSKPALHGAWIPDFLIRRADDSYLVVEIECPGKSIITRNNHFSAEATHSEKQVIDYKAFINERIQEMRHHFPNIGEPDGLVIIGMETKLTISQKRALLITNNNKLKLKTVGFDWVLERATSIIKNISTGEVDVEEGYRAV
jgi:hypothetical protein